MMRMEIDSNVVHLYKLFIFEISTGFLPQSRVPETDLQFLLAKAPPGCYHL